jgi:hypothetical protein
MGTNDVPGVATVTPQYPETGQVKFNTDTNKLQVFYNNVWNEISSAYKGRVNIVKDTFVGTGSQTTFAMTSSYDPSSEAMVLVFVGNIYQDPGVVYTIDGFNLNFISEAPANGVKVLVLHNFNSIHATV